MKNLFDFDELFGDFYLSKKRVAHYEKIFE